jgi:hypothetical protein
MDEAPSFFDGQGRRDVSMNPRATRVAFNGTGGKVLVECTSPGAIEGKLKTLPALFELLFPTTSLCKKPGKNDSIGRHHHDGHLGALHTLSNRNALIAKSANPERDRTDDSDGHNECARDRKRRWAAGCHPQQQRQHDTTEAK